MSRIRLQGGGGSWLLGLVFALQAALASAGYQETDGSLLMVFLITDTADCQFFLEHLNIVDEQQQRIIALRDELVREGLKLKSRALDLPPGDGGTPPALPDGLRVDQNRFEASVEDRFREILLPEQYEALIRMFRQRILLALHRCETFELFLKASQELELTEGERRSLQETTRRVADRFAAQQKELETTLMDELKRIVPPDLLAANQVAMELVERVDSVLPLDVVSPATDVEKWTDEDFGRFERKYLNSLVHACLGAEWLQQELAITGEQVAAMNGIRDSVVARDDLQPDRREIQRLAAAGDRAGLEQLFHEHEGRVLEFSSQSVNRMMEDVLLDHQREMLRKLAHYRRVMLESGGGRLGALLALVESAKPAGVDLQHVKEQIGKIRDHHIRSISSLRMTSATEVLESLSPKARERFSQLFHEPYDYKSERIGTVARKRHPPRQPEEK